MAATRRLGVIVALLAIATAEPAIAAGTITRETLKIDRDSRTYYMFVPDSLGPEPAALYRRPTLLPDPCGRVSSPPR